MKKISDGKRNYIVRLDKSGLTTSEIAYATGLGRTTVRHIIKEVEEISKVGGKGE